MTNIAPSRLVDLLLLRVGDLGHFTAHPSILDGRKLARIYTRMHGGVMVLVPASTRLEDRICLFQGSKYPLVVRQLSGIDNQALDARIKEDWTDFGDVNGWTETLST